MARNLHDSVPSSSSLIRGVESYLWTLANKHHNKVAERAQLFRILRARFLAKPISGPLVLHEGLGVSCRAQVLYTPHTIHALNYHLTAPSGDGQKTLTIHLQSLALVATRSFVSPLSTQHGSRGSKRPIRVRLTGRRIYFLV